MSQPTPQILNGSGLPVAPPEKPSDAITTNGKSPSEIIKEISKSHGETFLLFLRTKEHQIYAEIKKQAELGNMNLTFGLSALHANIRCVFDLISVDVFKNTKQ